MFDAMPPMPSPARLPRLLLMLRECADTARDERYAQRAACAKCKDVAQAMVLRVQSAGKGARVRQQRGGVRHIRQAPG